MGGFLFPHGHRCDPIPAPAHAAIGLRLFGYTAEAIGQPVSMLAASDRIDEMPVILAQPFGGRPTELTSRAAAMDGRLPIGDGMTMERDMAREHGSGSAAVLVMLIFLNGCAAHDVVATDASGYLADAADQVAAADWSKAEMIEIDMSEFSFAPENLQFRKGQPYRLHLVNTGIEPHTFTSEPFFKAIAVQKLTSGEQELPSPRLKSIGVAAGEAKDLYFVAVTSGTYPFDCSEPLHHTFGMSGTILVS